MYRKLQWFVAVIVWIVGLLPALLINSSAFAIDPPTPTPTRFVTPNGQPTAFSIGYTPFPTPTPSITFTPSLTFTPTITLTPSSTPEFEEVTLIVTKLEDTDDGKCDVRDCSLREAIETAPWGAKIVFTEGLTGTLKLTGNSDPLRPQSTYLLVDKTLSIIGLGKHSTDVTIDGNSQSIMVVLNGATLSLENLTFMHGGSLMGRTFGALLVASGSANITDCTFHDNEGWIGAINAYGSLRIVGSTFYNNTGDANGAIAIDSLWEILIINSTFYDNYGGQVSAVGAHHGTIINSTFRSPKVDPQASPFGPIIAGNLTLVNNIIEGKSADDRSVCIGIITDGGNNLQYPTSSCGDSIEVGDPRLSEPTDNGGRTLTLALQVGSTAIGRIKGETCPDSDQRGYLPPITDKSQVICDIGAFQTTYITATTSDVQAQE